MTNNKLKHYIISRFGIGCFCDHFYKDQMPVFEKVFLRSLQEQTDTNFTLILWIEPSIPNWVKEKLEQFITCSTFQMVLFVKSSLELLSTDVPFNLMPIDTSQSRIVTTRLDCDDAVSANYVELINNAAMQEYEWCVFSSPSGIEYFADFGLRVRRFSNDVSILSVLWFPGLSPECVHAYSVSHQKRDWQFKFKAIGLVNINKAIWVHTESIISSSRVTVGYSSLINLVLIFRRMVKSVLLGRVIYHWPNELKFLNRTQLSKGIIEIVQYRPCEHYISALTECSRNAPSNFFKKVRSRWRLNNFILNEIRLLVHSRQHKSDVEIKRLKDVYNRF